MVTGVPGPAPADPLFNLATVFGTVAAAVPDQEALVWRDRRFTYQARRPAHRRPGPLVRRAWPRGAHLPQRARRPRVGTGPRRPLPAQRQRVPRGDDRVLPGARDRFQHQLPVRRGGAGPPPQRRRRQGAGVPRRVRAAGRCHPPPRPQPRAPPPGRRRQRQPAARRRGGVRDRGADAGAGHPDAGAVGRRRLPALHRRHHRDAQGSALAPARRVRRGHGRPAVRLAGSLHVVRGDRRGCARRPGRTPLADDRAVHARCGPVVGVPHDQQRRHDRAPRQRGPDGRHRLASHLRAGGGGDHPGGRRRHGPTTGRRAGARRPRRLVAGGGEQRGCADVTGRAAPGCSQHCPASCSSTRWARRRQASR